ncbi:hypothetical protein [Sphingomonas phyllosphaerae]|uniref:hypothetical protein n=1 Tax=Sphingomonas phyllosphaerae TaxID=257003 RepID=UPI002FF8CAB3
MPSVARRRPSRAGIPGIAPGVSAFRFYRFPVRIDRLQRDLAARKTVHLIEQHLVANTIK